MTDKDYAPLTTACVRSLNDKLYEKRKVAALDIERMVKEFVLSNQTSQIKRIMKVLGDDFALSQNPNTRKGGLIGLAATAIALGKDSNIYVTELVKPVLACFHDQDSRVRYYACEALYNIVKVTRGSVLPFFNEIFDGLSKLASDPDQNVKNGTELLDRLIKDIVTESSCFDLVAFIPLLRERIYTKNAFARQFVVSWIGVLDAVPDINMLVLLPEILDGLFQILGDSNQEIRKMCQGVLAEFLSGIQKSKSGVNYAGMANILIIHSQNPDDLISYTAITWLNEFVLRANRAMLPFVSGVLTAILPNLTTNDIETKTKRSVVEAAEKLNSSLMNLIEEVDDNPTPTMGISPENTPEKEGGNEVAEKLDSGEAKVTESEEIDRAFHLGSTPISLSALQLDVASVIDVLCKMVTHKDFQTRIASLKWFCHLLNRVPKKTFRNMDLIFPVLISTLADEKQSDEALLLGLQALAEISSSFAGQQLTSVSSMGGNQTVIMVSSSISNSQQQTSDTRSVSPNIYFKKFMVSLVSLFKEDRHLLEIRGPFIIRHLCLLLNSEDIFRSLAEILWEETDIKFNCMMVQTLNMILLTSTELFELRTQLKDLSTKESCSLFCCLYQSWCASPVATIALCYLSQNYKHAADLMLNFGDLEITVDFLNEIDKLIQLLESPIFAYLRLSLLDMDNNHDLVKSLYGLLMLLPQSEAFELLRCRLKCIPHYRHPSGTHDSSASSEPDSRQAVRNIDFNELLHQFLEVQARHKEARRKHTGFLVKK
ncbi:hypothetical protein ACJMK2_010472 [Sinanodonta woodiana]|uniref:Protein VAC14 homolog n=1 Tax=Sinanodonta woodiana TaxID=1069815 RepID=A0ABD3VHW7_SINWO